MHGFGCNPQINFCHFCRSLNFLVIFWPKNLPKRIDIFCEGNSSNNFTWIFLKLGRCFQGLKMCMRFGCNPQIHFCHLFPIFGSTSTNA